MANDDSSNTNIASGGFVSSITYGPIKSEFRTLFEYEEVSVCKKCGCNDIGKCYYGKNELQEWLHRSCPNCGYSWFMHTKDYEFPKVKCGCDCEGCKS